ncbi:MAG: cation diffusion facilitator family transporter [Aerococcus sp.]|nr:cation diffusion facilitator family transporter [Aerococcus sp.]
MSQQSAQKDLKQAEKGSILSLCTYAIITVAKIAVGILFGSQAVLADGMNNLTDTINSLIILGGIRYSQRPADANHRYGHWKGETIATLLMSFIILYIGIEVLINSAKKLFLSPATPPHLLSAIVGALSGVLMLGVYLYNTRLSEKIHSLSLKASARDNLSDALTSFSTTVTVIAAQLGLAWLDTVMAVIVGGIIIRTGLEIFKESAFALTDGFDETKLDHYAVAILNTIPAVRQIRSIRGRKYGANIYLDITILIDGHLSVEDGHSVTEEVEDLLQDRFGIEVVDVHVEPYREPFISH